MNLILKTSCQSATGALYVRSKLVVSFAQSASLSLQSPFDVFKFLINGILHIILHFFQLLGQELDTLIHLFLLIVVFVCELLEFVHKLRPVFVVALFDFRTKEITCFMQVLSVNFVVLESRVDLFDLGITILYPLVVLCEVGLHTFLVSIKLLVIRLKMVINPLKLLFHPLFEILTPLK